MNKAQIREINKALRAGGAEPLNWMQKQVLAKTDISICPDELDHVLLTRADYERLERRAMLSEMGHEDLDPGPST